MARTKPSEQVRTWRLMPLIFLLPSKPRSPFCGPDTTLCGVHDPGRRFRRVAPCLAHPPRQQSRHIRPDAIGPEAVMPGADRLPGTEILRKRSPLAAGMFQVKAGI